MSETTNTRRTAPPAAGLARSAGLFLAGTAGAIALSGGFAGSASALTPAPRPTLPIAQAEPQPQPPVVPGVVVLPSDPGPVDPTPVPGPDQVAQPMPSGAAPGTAPAGPRRSHQR